MCEEPVFMAAPKTYSGYSKEEVCIVLQVYTVLFAWTHRWVQWWCSDIIRKGAYSEFKMGMLLPESIGIWALVGEGSPHSISRGAWVLEKVKHLPRGLRRLRAKVEVETLRTVSRDAWSLVGEVWLKRWHRRDIILVGKRHSKTKFRECVQVPLIRGLRGPWEMVSEKILRRDTKKTEHCQLRGGHPQDAEESEQGLCWETWNRRKRRLSTQMWGALSKRTQGRMCK